VLTLILLSAISSVQLFECCEVIFAFAVNYLSYGVFSSYAPIYDSSSSNLSKDDSDLLLATYGDEAGIQYAKR